MMSVYGTGSTARRGFSLIEILLVALLLVALGASLSYFYLGKGKPGEKTKTPIARAQSVVCMSNLRSIRQAVAAAQASDTDGKFPASLGELQLPAEILYCPDGKEPYQYDPQTGQVHCIHPGHENY